MNNGQKHWCILCYLVVQDTAKHRLYPRESNEVSQDITREQRWGIQGILSVDHDIFENDIETLLQVHDTINKTLPKQVQLTRYI